MNRKPITIHAFWDSRPGHTKQTRGIINALSKMTSVDIVDIEVPDYSFFDAVGDWLTFLFLKVTRQLSSHPESNNLIIGTGTHTHIPMLILKRENGGRVVTCMTPEPPFQKYIDLCCIPEHDRPKPQDNVFVTMGPPNTAVKLGVHRADSGLILIGGTDTKSHIWQNDQILSCIQTILTHHPDITWTISTSPRTPENMIPLCEKAFGEYDNAVFIPFEKTGAGWVETQYSKSKYAWVSADSMSMVFEALSAGCRVGVIPVKWKKKSNKIARAIEALERDQYIIPFDRLKDDQVELNRTVLNEARRCAKEILKRWWPDRLP